MQICSVFAPRNFLSVKLIVRNAGGGGRPGKKPAFNWKQKKLLNINTSENKKDFKLRPYGRLEDLNKFLQDSDVVLPFDGKDKSFEQGELADAIVPESSRKVIKVSSLFGSSKSFGMIPQKKNELKLRFSHSRIFGEKHKKKAEEQRLRSAAEAEKNTIRQNQ